MRQLAKKAVRSLGLHVSRLPANRFDATGDCLIRMKGLGYEPRVVIDGGANRGQFYRLASRVFPEAHFHLIEPQPACAPDLRGIVQASSGGAEFHEVAVTESGVSSVRMAGGGPNGGGTGAYVVGSGEHGEGEIEVHATSLDALLAGRIQGEDRALLKLDVESHELAALRGAESLLPRVEAALVEVAFYDVEGAGHPLFADVLAFLERCDFELYNVAALASRRRDERLRSGDVIFVRRDSSLLEDNRWE